MNGYLSSSFEENRLWTLGGCKGGVGKTVLVCNLAIELIKMGKNVLAVDLDLGSPNLHTYLGIQSPMLVLNDFLFRRVNSLSDVVLPTEIDGLSLISSAGSTCGQANLPSLQKEKIVKGLRAIEADFILIDIGAGSSFNVMDFFSLTDTGLVVTTSEPSSIVSTYGFIKNVLLRRISRELRNFSLATEIVERARDPDGPDGLSTVRDLLAEMEQLSSECPETVRGILDRFRPKIIINMASDHSEVQLGDRLRIIAEKYLSVDLECYGCVVEDLRMKESARRMRPFVMDNPRSAAAICLRTIARRLMDAQEPTLAQSATTDHQARGAAL